VSHHFKWQPWPGSGQNWTAFWGGGARGQSLLLLSGSCRSTSFDASSFSGSGYSAGLLTTIGRNLSLSHRKIGESTQVSSGHSLYHYPETSFWFSMSPNTNEKQASRHQWTLYAPEAPHEVYLSKRVFSFAYSSSVHSRSTRCAFSIGIWTSGFPFASFESDHFLSVQGFAIWIIRWAASYWASLSSVRIACIKLFTTEYSVSVPCISITVSSSGSSGAPENSHIIWKHQSLSEWNSGVAVTWSLNPILALIAIRQPTRFVVLYRWDSSNIPKLHEQCESWPLLDGFALDVKVPYDTRWIFHRFSGSSRLVFGSLWVRFTFSACNKLMSWKSVANVISSITLFNVSATPGIVTTRIGSRVDFSAVCPGGGVFWISMRRRGTALCLSSGYHSHSSPIIPGKSFCTIFTHSARVFPHKIDSGSPTATFSVSSMQIIAAATEVKVFPSPISFATSAPGISASQTHLLTMNQIAQTWRARIFFPGRPGIEHLWHGTRSSIDWRIRWAFSILTPSTWHSCSNPLLIVLRIVFSTELVFSGSRSSLPSTCSWTYLAPWPVFLSSSMISFSCSVVSWADGLIFWRSCNSLRCYVFHRQAFGPNMHVEYNQFYSLNQNLHYYYYQSLSHLPHHPPHFHFDQLPPKSKYTD